MRDCLNCLWCDQCGEEGSQGCKEYTPIDEDGTAALFYESILAENASEYELFAAEYSDGNWEVDDD